MCTFGIYKEKGLPLCSVTGKECTLCIFDDSKPFIEGNNKLAEKAERRWKNGSTQQS